MSTPHPDAGGLTVGTRRKAKIVKFAVRLADLIGVLVVAAIAFLPLIRLALPIAPRRTGRRLLVIDSAYSAEVIKSRNLERFVTQRDLDGYFDTVYSVHPCVGADPTDRQIGRINQWELDRHNVFLESYLGRFHFLRILRLTNFLIAQLLLLRHLHRLVRREGIGLIQACDPHYLGLLARAIGHANRIPLVVLIQGNYDLMWRDSGLLAYPRLLRTRSIELSIARSNLRHADLVIGMNDNNLQYAIENGARPGRGVVMRYGQTIESIHFNDPAKRLPPDLSTEGVVPGRFVVHIGRLERVKLVDDAVRAFAITAQAHPDAVLLLVGDGTMKPALKQVAEDLGIGDRVRFLGNKDQHWLANMLPHAGVILSPLTGRALAEAVLSGTPTVAYDYEWQGELVIDGQTGRLVAHRNWQSMGRAAADLLNDPDEARRLGQAGRDLALCMMDPSSIQDALRRAYEGVLSSGTRIRRRTRLTGADDSAVKTDRGTAARHR